MSYRRPHNPQVVSNSKIRSFDGIGGPRTQTLKRFNAKGWDISNGVANDVSDLHLAEIGSILLRPGMRRLGSEDYSINWIGQMNIGGLLRYGIISNNGLTMVDLPQKKGYELIPWPDDPVPSPYADWPLNFFKPDDPVDEHLPEDPSMPIDKQVCTVGWEWTSSPDTISFTMPYAGTLPPSQKWWEQNVGYRPDTPLIAGYNVRPAWLDGGLLSGQSWIKAPCIGVQVGGIWFQPNGKDSDGNWLAGGVYTHGATLTISDGTVLACAVELTVLVPVITLTPTSDSLNAFLTESGNLTSTVGISNTGDAGSFLNWEVASITGDAALAAIITVSSSSGPLAKNASENATITITNPGTALTSGTYNATVTFRDQYLTSETSTFDIAVETRPRIPDNFYVWTGVNKTGTQLTAYKDSTNTWRTNVLLPHVAVAWVIKIDEDTAQVQITGGSCTLVSISYVSAYEILFQTGINASGVPIAAIRATGVPSGLPVGDLLYLGEV